MNVLQRLPPALLFAVWPTLAACIALYYLRDADTRWVVEKPSTSN